MKKVFEAKMTVKFGSSPRDLSKVNSFASADGIEGEVRLSEVVREDSETFRVKVSVFTERKRQFPDFETYLNLIMTALSHHNKVSVLALKEIQNCSFSSGLKDAEEIERSGDFKIVRDQENDFLLVKISNEMIINYFQTIEEAKEALDYRNK